MSFVLPTGAKAPDYDLPGHDGRTYRLADVRGPMVNGVRHVTRRVL